MADDVTSEREELIGFLDYFRLITAKKASGLDRAEATRVATPTGVTILGLIKHLTWVERLWFRTQFAGEPREEVEQARSYDLDPDDTVESVLAAYDDACARSRAIVAATPSLEDRCVLAHWHFGHASLRWVMLHMIEETARHAGHLDILRELTDGRTGD